LDFSLAAVGRVISLARQILPSATVTTASYAEARGAFPDSPGMVVRQVSGEEGDQLPDRGFRLSLDGMNEGAKPKPINNARSDMLLSFL
jgi:hypothetical protein